MHTNYKSSFVYNCAFMYDNPIVYTHGTIYPYPITVSENIFSFYFCSIIIIIAHEPFFIRAPLPKDADGTVIFVDQRIVVNNERSRWRNSGVFNCVCKSLLQIFECILAMFRVLDISGAIVHRCRSL